MNRLNNKYSFIEEDKKPDIELRLKEYIKRKNFYKKNNIQITFSLEDEYNITMDDLKQIENYIEYRNKRKK